MKKTLVAFIVCIMLIQVMPVAALGITSDKITVDIYVGESYNFMKTEAVFELYNMANELLGTQSVIITGANCTYKITFGLEPYNIGEQFQLKLVKGFMDMQHYDSVIGEGSCVVLSTYSFIPEGSEEVIIGDYFGVNCTPYPEQNIVVSMNGEQKSTAYHLKRDNDDILAEVSDMMKFFMISEYDYTVGEDKVTINHMGKEVIFTLDSTEVMVNGEAWIWPTVPQILDKSFYLPTRMMGIIFGGDVTINDVEDIKYVDITLKKSLEMEERLNNDTVGSKTDYLLWVRKGDYSVNLFKGEKGNWKHVYSFACAIGAPNTPTPTGVFDYYAKEKYWNYPEYYVGPIMRFYGYGYALHSTKIKYDGSWYDNRTGVGISLGCVRVRKSEIEWLYNNIPLYTTVYVTEN